MNVSISPNYSDRDCTHCSAMVTSVSEHASSNQANFGTTILLAQDFCPTLPIPEAVEVCAEWVIDFVPFGFDVIAAHMSHHAEETCAAVFELEC